MVNSTALIITVSLSFGGIIALLLMFYTLRKQMREMISSLVELSEVLESQLEALKMLSDMDAKNKESIQRLINRQEYHIALSKYILSGTRLDFIAHRCNCVEHEDYENAAQLESAIHKIEELLNTE